MLIKVSRIVFIDSSNKIFNEFIAWEFCIWTRFETIRLPEENSDPFSQNYPSRREARVEIVGWWLCIHSTYSTVPRMTLVDLCTEYASAPVLVVIVLPNSKVGVARVSIFFSRRLSRASKLTDCGFFINSHFFNIS